MGYQAMKITNIKSYLLNYRLTSVYRKMFGSDKKEGEAIHTRESWFAGVNRKENVLVRVETDEGFYGVGEALAHPVSGETAEGIVRMVSHFGRVLKGADPCAFAEIHRRMDSLIVNGSNGAKAAVDVACFDILGKASERPLWSLLGGRGNIPFGCCAHMAREAPEAVARRGKELVDRGYTSLELKCVGRQESIESDCDRILALREAVPSEIPIVADPNQNWDVPKEALSALNGPLEGIPNFFLEQPVPATDPGGLKEITSGTEHRIIADEIVLRPDEAQNVAVNRLADVVSFKIMKNGGMWKILRGIPMVEHAGLEVRIDWVQASRLMDTAAAHLHTVLTRPAVDPAVDYHLRLQDDIVAEGGIRIDADGVHLPEGPGLGVEVDWDLVEALSSA